MDWSSPSRSRAVVFTGPGVVEVREVDVPGAGPDDVVVTVSHSWISNGTESSYLRGERVGGDVPRRDGDSWPFPVVAGYQKVGTVEWVGERVSGLEPGDVVFAAFGRVSGMFHDVGGHVSPSILPREMVWRLPRGVDPLAFAGLTLTQVGYNCGARPPVEVGDAAVVLGDGMVGQWAAQTLAWRGADVVLVGRHPDRLAMYRPRVGSAVLNAAEQDVRQVVEEMFPHGVAVLVDTVGSIDAVEDLTTCLRRFGHIVSAGFYGLDDRLSLQPLREREIGVDVVAGLENRRMDETLQLVAAGHLQTLPLITHHFPVAKAAEAWQMIVDRREPFLGVILDW